MKIDITHLALHEEYNTNANNKQDKQIAQNTMATTQIPVEFFESKTHI